MICIEPLLIQTHDVIGDWQHPKLNELSEKMENNNDGVYTGDLLKLVLIVGSEKYLTFIISTDYKSMNTAMDDDEYMYAFISNLLMLLNESMWIPDGTTSFAKSDYGESFNKAFPLYDVSFRYMVTVDVSISTDGKKWCYKK
jgi:hypothetical protein